MHYRQHGKNKDAWMSNNIITEWSEISGYPNYAVGSDGEVRNTKSGRVLSRSQDYYGYLYVTLFRGNEGRKFKIHTLVCHAFHGPRPTGYQINHKDGVKTNNESSNLEYVTPSENTKHAIRLGLFRPQLPPQKLNEQLLRSIRELLPAHTNVEIAARFNLNDSTVSRIRTGKIWKHVA